MHKVSSQLVACSTRRARLSSPAILRSFRVRTLHNRVLPPYNVEDGMGDFLPPAALKMIAEDYQKGLLDRLNDEVRDTPQSSKTVAQTVIDAAQDPAKVLMFNYASEALNNSYFLSCLKPPQPDRTSHEDDIVSSLFGRIRTDFGSLTQLKSTFSAAALGMFGSGWVWLVCDQTGSLAVYPTFGTGTLLIRSQEQLQRKTGAPEGVIGEELIPVRPQGIPAAPLSSPSSPTSGASSPPKPLYPSSHSRSFSTSISLNNYLNSHDGFDTNTSSSVPIGDTLFPLLCISVHEHAWVSAGYGVWGKEEYVKRFWSVANWQQVSEHYEKYVPETRRYGRYL